MISPVQTADETPTVCSFHHQGVILMLVSELNYSRVSYNSTIVVFDISELL